MKVKDIMTTPVITVKEDQTRQQAATLMAKHRISGVPVVNEDDMVVGIVTEYDVIGRKGQKVRDIMTRSIISVSPDTDLEDVGHILVNQNIRRLPVLEGGRLIGIISRSDLVREVAMRWVCDVCGEVTHSETQPERCPRCGGVKVTASAEPLPPGS